MVHEKQTHVLRVSPHTFRHTFAVAQADVTAQHRQFSPVDALLGGKKKGSGR